MSAQKPQMLRNIILSLTIIISIIVINVGVVSLGSQIGIGPNTVYYDVILMVFNCIVAFFSLLLFGSIVEYTGREPGVFTIAIAYAIPVLLAYYSNLLRDNVRIAITLVLYIAILVYILLARS